MHLIKELSIFPNHLHDSTVWFIQYESKKRQLTMDIRFEDYDGKIQSGLITFKNVTIIKWNPNLQTLDWGEHLTGQIVDIIYDQKHDDDGLEATTWYIQLSDGSPPIPPKVLILEFSSQGFTWETYEGPN